VEVSAPPPGPPRRNSHLPGPQTGSRTKPGPAGPAEYRNRSAQKHQKTGTTRVDPQSSLRSDESGAHSRGAPPVDNASKSRRNCRMPRTGSKPGAENPRKGSIPAESRLNRVQNIPHAGPPPQREPQTAGLIAESSRKPEAEPDSPLGRHQTAVRPELPDPPPRRGSIHGRPARTPAPNALSAAEHRVQTRADDFGAVPLERHAERGKKTDRHPAAGTPAAQPPHLNPLFRRNPYRPQTSALAFRTGMAAQRTPRRTLGKNIRMAGGIGLNTGGKQTD